MTPMTGIMDSMWTIGILHIVGHTTILIGTSLIITDIVGTDGTAHTIGISLDISHIIHITIITTITTIMTTIILEIMVILALLDTTSIIKQL